ncbi:hypothetical protein TNCT_9861 [Trichonephila clavata]|uniref:Uncharacterized protein n=1 Tax=Trichonephila clavata TaxID=2740835 RepID=A0A8X6LXU8_TRICU|nr:hypothetical protein TNCT_9861 [Trichonephila clavata]
MLAQKYILLYKKLHDYTEYLYLFYNRLNTCPLFCITFHYVEMSDGFVFICSLEKGKFVKDGVEAIKDGHVEGGAVVIVRQRTNPPLEDFILSDCFIPCDLPLE